MSSTIPMVPERHTFLLSTTLAGVTVSFQCTALRYPVSPSGVTLVLTHGISSCKEIYHVTVMRLLALNRQDATYDIREIWSIDFPNHGEAAMRNRHLLEEHKARGARQQSGGICTNMDFAVYLDAFLSLPHFRGHNLVGIGHSGSCTTWIHALTKSPHVYPRALILIEPTLMFTLMPDTDPRSIHGAANVRGALAKRDRWPSRVELGRWLVQSRKSVCARWDPRVLDLYVERAFEMMPEGQGQAPYVTPTLRKDEESPLYACLEHTVESSQLAAVCKALSEDGRRGVHIIWGEFEEFISKTAKAEILDAAEHRVVTQHTVMGCGHLVPQLKPDALGDVIHEILGQVGSGDTRSLL